TGVVEGDGFAAVYNLDLWRPFDPERGDVFRRPEPSPAIDAARGTATFRTYLDFAGNAVWAATPEPGGATRVSAVDLRFGTPRRPRFIATAMIDSAGHVRDESFAFGAPRPR
ncbi:MAG: hypothetical protein ACRD96_28785, partial [Bryobacteraceae bacterium]